MAAVFLGTALKSSSEISRRRRRTTFTTSLLNDRPASRAGGRATYPFAFRGGVTARLCKIDVLLMR